VIGARVRLYTGLLRTELVIGLETYKSLFAENSVATQKHGSTTKIQTRYNTKYNNQVHIWLGIRIWVTSGVRN